MVSIFQRSEDRAETPLQPGLVFHNFKLRFEISGIVKRISCWLNGPFFFCLGNDRGFLKKVVNTTYLIAPTSPLDWPTCSLSLHL